jgi:hypothetical protein
MVQGMVGFLGSGAGLYAAGFSGWDGFVGLYCGMVVFLLLLF